MGTGPAASANTRSRASLQMAPDAAMCVFSMLTSDTAGWWFSDDRRASVTSSARTMPSTSSTVWNWTPAFFDAAPYSYATTCWRRPATTAVPGAAQDAQGHLVRHHTGGDEECGRLPDPGREGLLERPHRRVLAVVVVADLGLGHGAPHGRRRPGDGVAAQVDAAAVHAVRLNGPPLASAGDQSSDPRRTLPPPRPSGPVRRDALPPSFGDVPNVHDLFGVEILEASPEQVVMRLPVDWKVHQPYGILHGGVSALLAESAASFGAALNAPPGRGVVGIELNASHLRPVSDGHLTARATPIRVGRTVQVWSIGLTDDDDRAICAARCTLAVIDMPEQASGPGPTRVATWQSRRYDIGVTPVGRRCAGSIAGVGPSPHHAGRIARKRQ